MIGFSQVVLIGSLTTDPGKSAASGGYPDMATFGVQVGEGQESATVRCMAYGGMVAQTMKLRRGDAVVIVGSLGEFKTPGESQTALSVKVERVIRLGRGDTA